MDLASDGPSKLATIGLPLLVLAVLAAGIIAWNPGDLLVRDDVPPAEELTFQKTTLKEATDDKPARIILKVTNEGPDPVTVSQVLVDEAYWAHTIEPGRTIERLQTATITLEYPWVEGEAHEVMLVSETGATFAHEIELAVATPGVTGQTLWTYALIGLLVGVAPIFAGLLWYPAIQRAGAKVEAGILAFTIGLLAFLTVESLEEGLELAELAPSPIGGPGLVLLSVTAAMAILIWVGGRAKGGARAGSQRSRLVAAYSIAAGVGLHNLGEGLAIGAAYAVGEAALGSFLILGFTLHNVTEGPAIVSPLARRRTALGHLGMMGLIAGVPTVFGAWIGGFAFSPLLGAIFFGLGAGAMIQVIYQVGKELSAGRVLERAPSVLAMGFLVGVALMWGTGLMT